MSWAVWLVRWEWIPSVWVGCGLALAAYPLFPGARAGARAAAWVAGVAAVFAALCSGLDIVGDAGLFSVHMAQHLVLAMVAPPLLVRGLPDPTIDRLLRSRAGRALQLGVRPLVAASAYCVVLLVWHVPAVFDAALTHAPLHIAQHLSFLAVGLLFWWAVIVHRPGAVWNLSAIGEVAYLTAGALPAVVVGLTLALLRHPVYSFYLHRTARFGLTPGADQLLGGLLMFAFDNLLMAVVAGVYFWRLLSPGDEGTISQAAA